MPDITAFPIQTVVEEDATQEEMQAGTEVGVRRMSPKNVADAVAALATAPTALSQLSDDATHRLTTDAEKATWNGKQAALGFTAENVANKSTSTALGTSDTRYPTQNAVKNYVDNGLAVKAPIESPTFTGTVGGVTAVMVGAVPLTRQVNGHELSGDVSVTAEDVGLGNCDNTSDANKPVSTAMQTALGAKADLVNGKVPIGQLADGAPDGTKFIRDDGTLAVPSGVPELPDQTGNSGKFLHTDGSAVDWRAVPGGGDMLAATYDPQHKAADAFSCDNHTSGTTNKVYTSSEQTKLAGIAAGATVQVNSDWTASSGVAQILNKPAIPSTTADIADSSDKRYCTDAQKTVIGNTSGTNSGNETATTIGALTSGATPKATPVDADVVGLSDSAASNILKALSWANIKATLKTYFDSLYTLANLGGVPTTRQVNSKALSADVTLTTADVADSADKRYCTDAQKTVIGNTSGTNTGDQTIPVGGTPALTLGTANTAGSSPNFLRRDDTILAFDATDPSTQAFGDSAAVGVATTVARRDHKHAMPAAPTLAGLGGVPTTRTVAGHALSGDVTVSASDVGLGNVTNNAQVKKAASSTDTAIPQWSGTGGDTLAAGGLAAPSGTIVGTSDTQTLTNKRVTKRVLSAASYTTDTGTSLNCDTQDVFVVTAQAGDLKFNNPGGTPTAEQMLRISVTGTAARALTWDTQFEASTIALPTTTVTTNRLDIGFVWRADTSKWHCIAVA